MPIAFVVEGVHIAFVVEGVGGVGPEADGADREDLVADRGRRCDDVRPGGCGGCVAALRATTAARPEPTARARPSRLLLRSKALPAVPGLGSATAGAGGDTTVAGVCSGAGAWRGDELRLEAPVGDRGSKLVTGEDGVAVDVEATLGASDSSRSRGRGSRLGGSRGTGALASSSTTVAPGRLIFACASLATSSPSS